MLKKQNTRVRSQRGRTRKQQKKSEERDYTWNVQSKEIKHHAHALMSIAIKKGDAVNACHIIEK